MSKKDEDRIQYRESEKLPLHEVAEIISDQNNFNDCIDQEPEIYTETYPENVESQWKKEAEKLKWWWWISCKNCLWKKGDEEYYRNYHLPEFNYSIDNTNVNHRNVWLLAIQKCRANHVHPLSLVKQLFPELPSPSFVLPNPKELLKKEVIQKYFEYEKSKDLSVKNRWELESALFVASYKSAAQVSALTQEAALRYTIQRPDIQLSPLFRYCMAHNYKFSDLEKRWSILAKLQFLETPRCYLKHWREFLPPALIEIAIMYNVTPDF